MEDERENKAGTKEIAAPTCSIGYGGGGLDFLVNNQVQRREGIRDAAAKFGRPCGSGDGAGTAGGAFVLLSRLPSHCLFLRCDALSRWMDAATGSSLPPSPLCCIPLVDLAAFLEGIEKHSLNQDMIF